MLDVFSANLGPLCKIFKLEKWSFLVVFSGFTVFCPKKQRVSVCESFLGRFGPYFRVTAPGGVLWGARRVKFKFLVFPGFSRALVQSLLFRFWSKMTCFDWFSLFLTSLGPQKAVWSTTFGSKLDMGAVECAGGSDWLGGAPVQPEIYK